MEGGEHAVVEVDAKGHAEEGVGGVCEGGCNEGHEPTAQDDGAAVGGGEQHDVGMHDNEDTEMHHDDTCDAKDSCEESDADIPPAVLYWITRQATPTCTEAANERVEEQEIAEQHDQQGEKAPVEATSNTASIEEARSIVHNDHVAQEDASTERTEDEEHIAQAAEGEQHAPNRSENSEAAGSGSKHQQRSKRKRDARETDERDNELIGNYIYPTDAKRVRTTTTNDDMIRSGRFRVGGWNADGSERLVPVAPDNASWVAWDAIRRQKQKRQAEQSDEGCAKKRARFGDG